MVGQKFPVKWDLEEWKMIPYDVQLIGGIVLHESRIAEMRTGEGKTLVATLPAYLNAIAWEGVHVVTVNDYLASRDGEWMGHLYERLGLTTGVVTKWVKPADRRAQYEADITYVENSELGFDYLRDNLTKTLDERVLVWRPLGYAIIDEVDSILIDEARTPLIISQPWQEPTEKYEMYAKLVTLLTPSKWKKKISKWFLNELLKDVKGEEEDTDDSGDYYIDEKSKTVTLSSTWIEKLESLLKVDNLYKDMWYDEIHHIENALRARAVYHKDKEYLLKDNQVMIVDENTWRAMPWRRFSQGLHQAIEAKENVTIQKESKTLASITYQHFFKQYKKLSGMTGTALTEAEEFEKIYDLETIIIPTNKPILRVDKNDMVYFNQDAKRKAVVDHISFYHTAGVPILIGTSSIQTSELVSSILRKMTLPHTVLNAKYHEQEANIVSNAGKQWSLVVATNMAWRGTDIKLDPSLNPTIAKNYVKAMIKNTKNWTWFNGVVYSETEYNWMKQAFLEHLWIEEDQLQKSVDTWIQTGDIQLKTEFNKKKKTAEDGYAAFTIRPVWVEEPELEERDLHFGLFILGTEKHESRRIDNQLRGRAWRQWDPGISQFFVWMDDEIMRKMWGNKIQSIARMMLSKEDLETMAFTQSQFTNSIQRAQKQMEWYYFGIRKHLFDYDSVINKQRERIYAKRDEILGVHTTSHSSDNEEIIKLSMKDEIVAYIAEIVQNQVAIYTAASPWNLWELLETLSEITGASFLEEDYAAIKSPTKLEELLTQQLTEAFEAKISWVEEERVESVIKRAYLFAIDKNWMQHITDMQYLREKVWLYGYAQLDPLVIYKREAYDKFQGLLVAIRQQAVAYAFRSTYEDQAAQQFVAQSVKKTGMMDLLKAVTKWLSKEWTISNIRTWDQAKQTLKEQIQLKTWESATVLENNDDFEVLEVDDTTGSESDTGADYSQVKKKVRPNDKVNVIYTDWTKKMNVKRKTVKVDVESGKAKLI